MHRFIGRVGAAIAVVALSLAPFAVTGVAQAAPTTPTYQDTSIALEGQSVDAITAIQAAASWSITSPTGGFTSTTNLGSAITGVPVPSWMHAQFTASDANGNAIPNAGGLTWSIVSETNIPSGVLIGINPVSGLLTVQPPSGQVIAANNQNITVVVKVTDGVATAFETLTGQPIVFAGLGGSTGCPEGETCISAINVTATTDAVTLNGTTDNVTGFADFASTPAGANLSAANLPPGVALSGVHLDATTAIPDRYSGLSVTATDAMTATARDTFSVEVDGATVRPNLPYLYGGHASDPFTNNASRENVYVVLGGQASCLHFEIVGPGQINGHQGWVPGHLGLNAGVYGGLLAHHGYTVYYQPVTQNADGSPTGSSSCAGGPTTPVAGSHWGYVYFISGH